MALCPNCQQPLPDPPESFCPSCGAALGASRQLPSRSAGGSIPWEERDRRGFVGAFIETTKQVLTAPTDFFRRMPVEGGIPSPLIYGVLAGYIGLLAGAIYSTAIQGVLTTGLLSSIGNREGVPMMGLLQGGLGIIAQVLLGPIQVTVGIFFMSAIYHVLLLVFGGGGKGFEATFRVVCFGQAASVLGIIPVCGMLAGLYSIVLYIIGLSESHGISRGKAALVVLVPIVLVCCCCAVGITMMAGGLASVLSQLQNR